TLRGRSTAARRRWTTARKLKSPVERTASPQPDGRELGGGKYRPPVVARPAATGAAPSTGSHPSTRRSPPPGAPGSPAQAPPAPLLAVFSFYPNHGTGTVLIKGTVC